MQNNLAAIDIGTNSIHLVIVKVSAQQRFEVLTQEKEVVRLGSGSKDMKYLAPDAMERAIQVLVRFHQLAEAYKATIRAVATSAVREALNQGLFLEKVQHEAGIQVEVISGFEEARLIYLGVLQALPIYEKRVMLVDIGGGSTEFLVGERGEVSKAHSLKLGAIRLTDRFFLDDPLEAKNINKCRQYVKAFISPMAREFRAYGCDLAIGSSGTIMNLAQITLASRRQEVPRFLNNFTFSRSELEEVVSLLVRADTLKKRQKIEGLDPRRADIILAGALLLEQIFEAFRINALTVSGYALREGVIQDVMRQERGGTLHHLTDIRYRGVLHLAETCRYEKDHAHQVTRLALQLYDQLEEAHQLPSIHREYLEAAGLLHDIGYFISHAQHHRHSYYIIRNSEYLAGFTSREMEIIAQVARYHRKSAPKQKHDEFSRLSLEDQRVVKLLAGMLRVADGLDRAHASQIQRIQCKLDSSSLELHLEANHSESLALEIYTASLRQGLLEEMLARKIKIVTVNAVPGMEEPALPD